MNDSQSLAKLLKKKTCNQATNKIYIRNEIDVYGLSKTPDNQCGYFFAVYSTRTLYSCVFYLLENQTERNEMP